MIWTSNHTGVTPGDLYNLVTRNVSQLIKSIAIRPINISAEPALSVDLERNPEYAVHLFREYRHRNLGRCHSFNLGDISRRAGIHSVKVT